MLVKDIKLGNYKQDDEVTKIICISNMNNKYDLIIGEKYLAPTRFWIPATNQTGKKIKILGPNLAGKEIVLKSESYIDIHDLNRNKIGNYPTHLFQELSLFRNDKIETILK